MRWILPISPIIAAHGCGAKAPSPDPAAGACMVIEKREDLASCVGKSVTLRGVVSRTKTPEILGVEIDSSAYDLAEQLAEATGVLATYVVPADIDADGLHSAHKSPGTYYVLQVDGGLARPRAVR